MLARPAALLSTFVLLLGCGGDDRPGGDTETTGLTSGDPGSDAATAAPTTTDATSGTGTSGQDPTGMSSETDDVTTADPPVTTTEDPPDTTGGPGPAPGALCEPVPKCDAAPPTIPGQGEPEGEYSRGRDMFYVEGEEQWVIAKFTKWGFPADKDIEGSAVHLFLDRGCAGEWEDLGVAITTVEGEHAPVQGVDDSGGRVYYKISQSDQLEPGRHRVHGVVEEFWDTVDITIDVVPAGAPIFVSDVDGTLTTSESEEAWDFLLGDIPEANPFAAEALSLLASKGYRPMYLTARPEWLDRRTREFVALRGFPAGIIHTTLTYTGGMGDTAAAYKTGEFQLLKDKGLVPTWLFGNKDSDAEAFESTMIPTDQRVLFQFTDAVHGARRIESYQELLAEFEALPDLCGR
ncbi:LNS2 domain-containing protein [Nannocystis bainbridge]|uniref:Phosphatidylinositol transfer protein n=1 Tax=Nannocystis bainbridge TaxID=2995303 RepID=A0ABT5E4E3_9BACT|nr:phosphatidylinositol transfer protein [Nannocystis bainbridge]MDC0720711.1 phosphatidylinositol transfer protein [Nannocystis bainbridge]